MGLTLVSLSGFQRGIESDETGVNAQSFAVRYFMQFKEFLNNYQGQFRGFAMPDKLSREVTIQGEVSGATGLMAAVWNVAVTPANDVGTFIGITAGSNAGGLYLDEVTESQEANGWRSVDMTLTSHPLIT